MTGAQKVPTLKDVYRSAEEFTLLGDSGETFKAKWEWEPTCPNKRDAGITGWATRNGERIRLHVCAYNPCICR